MNSIATSIWGAIPRRLYHKNPTGQATTIRTKPTHHTVSNTAVTEYEVFYNKFHQPPLNYQSSLTNSAKRLFAPHEELCYIELVGPYGPFMYFYNHWG